MTILSQNTQARIRRYMQAVAAYVAYEYDCEVSDVFATLPIDARQDAGIAGGVTAPLASHSPETATDTAAPSDNPAKPTGPEAKHAAEGPLSNGPGGMHGPCGPIPPSQSTVDADVEEQGLIEIVAGNETLGAEPGLAGDQPWASIDGADGEQEAVLVTDESGARWIDPNAPDAPAIDGEERPDFFPSSPSENAPAPAQAGEESATSSAPNQDQPSSLGGDPVASDAPPPASDEAGEVDAPNPTSPAPIRRQGLKTLIFALQAEHPYWTASQIAEAADTSPNHVRKTFSGTAITLPIPKRGPVPGSLADRIWTAHREHPEFTAGELADFLGADRDKVAVRVSQLKVPVRKLTDAELASKARQTLGMETEAQEAPEPISATVTPAEPETPASDDASEPDEPSPPEGQPSILMAPLKAVVRKPAAARHLHLRDNATGLYLGSAIASPDGELIMMNKDRDTMPYLWRGTPMQLKAVRSKFPATFTLHAVASEPADKIGGTWR